MDEDKSALILAAIIAIVAIFGLVLAYSNNGATGAQALSSHQCNAMSRVISMHLANGRIDQACQMSDVAQGRGCAVPFIGCPAEPPGREPPRR